MAKTKVKPLHPAVRVLVDEYAKARIAKTAAEKEEQRLRTQMLDQFTARGETVLTGDAYEVEKSVGGREFLDTKAVRALLTPAQIAAVTKSTPVVTLTPRAINEVIVRAVA